MTHRSPWKLLLGLLAALSLLLAACGDDDDETAMEASDTTEEDDDAEDTDDDSGDEEQSDDADGPDLDGADLGECGFFVEFASAFEDVDPSELFAAGQEVDFGSFFGPIAERFQNVAEAAPGEIQAAFRVVADEFGEVADQLEGVVIDLSDPQSMDPEAMAALESMETSFDTPEFDAATEEIEAWMNENCSDFADAIDLDTFGS